MSKVVSIIIPTYNMEAYLQKCLSSLLIPSLNKIEVLVVNDGSHDRSLEIAQDFAENTRIVHRDRQEERQLRVMRQHRTGYGHWTIRESAGCRRQLHHREF